MWEFPTYLNFHMQEIKIEPYLIPLRKLTQNGLKT